MILFIGKKWGGHIAASSIELSHQVIQNENIVQNPGQDRLLCREGKFNQLPDIVDYPKLVKDFSNSEFSKIEVKTLSNKITTIDQNDILMQDRNKTLLNFIKDKMHDKARVPLEQQQALKCTNKEADTLYFALLLSGHAPVMYLYTDQEIEVKVKFDDNEPTICHPSYPGRWEFRVLPSRFERKGFHLVEWGGIKIHKKCILKDS